MGMLVLGRKKGEEVLIEDTETNEVIRVTIIGINHRGVCRLGFDASSKYRIMRDELLNRKDLELKDPCK